MEICCAFTGLVTAELSLFFPNSLTGFEAARTINYLKKNARMPTTEPSRIELIIYWQRTWDWVIGCWFDCH